MAVQCGEKLPYIEAEPINEFEVNNSKRLQHAIRMNWVEVVEDRGLLKRALIMKSKPQVKEAATEDKTDMIEMAKEMAKTMVKEMMKDGEIVKELIKQENKDLKQEIRSIKESIGEQNITIKEEKKEKEPFIIEEEKPDEIFVDVEESGIKANIVEVGKEKEEKQDLSGSLEKMKRFRRKPLKEKK